MGRSPILTIHQRSMDTPRVPWSWIFALWLLALSVISIALAWVGLVTPPRYGRRVFPVLAALVVYGLLHMKETSPDDTFNEIWGLTILMWLAHLAFMLFGGGRRVSTDSKRLDTTKASHSDSIVFIHPRMDDQNELTELLRYNHRAAWKMLFNPRGINTSWQVSTTVARTDDKAPTSRLRFVRDRALRICGRLLLLCLVEVAREWVSPNPVQDYAPSKQVLLRRVLRQRYHSWMISAADSSGSDSPITSREIMLRFWAAFYSNIPFALTLESYHDVLAIFFVSMGIDEQAEWPSLFGKLQDAYTVRNWWSRYWHRLVYRSFMFFSSVISLRALGTVESTPTSRLVKNIVVFLISGCFHLVVYRQQRLGCGSSAVFNWYALQPLALILEALVQHLWSKVWHSRALRVKKVIGRVVGYCWVIGWLAWSVPKHTYPVGYCLAKGP